MCCGCDTSYIVSVHIQCQAFIYTLSLCRGHSWRVRLAKQETLTPPGHLVSPLVYRGPWMSTVVLYCWCHSDSASVLLYFTLAKDPACKSVPFRIVWGKGRVLTQSYDKNPIPSLNKKVKTQHIRDATKKFRLHNDCGPNCRLSWLHA